MDQRLENQGGVIWLFGLSGAGKTTLANALEGKLAALGALPRNLDGDEIRTGLCRDLGFSQEDRDENIRRVAEVAKLFSASGLVAIVSCITPLRRQRAAAREIIGEDGLVLAHLACPFEVCAQRDPKGLYKKALAGEIANFTGKDSAFERPEDSDGCLDIHTADDRVDTCVEAILSEARKRFL